MIFLFLDVILSYFCATPTFLFLMNILWIDKKRWSYFILINLVLDLLICNTYFLNTIILFLLFIFYKRLKITKVNIKTYLLSITLLYLLYVLMLGVLHGYYIESLLIFLVKNYFVNLLFYLICYKIGKNYIKLCR